MRVRRVAEKAAASAMTPTDTKKAVWRPEVKARAKLPWIFAVPTKMANASEREIDLDAASIATANENTIPILENVRSIPEAMPNT